MEIKINTSEVSKKLYKKVEGSGWETVFGTYLLSSDFQDLLDNLVKLRNSGKRITPPLKNVFKAFTECPLDTTNVVIIGQDPYPQFNVADGIAFSCGNTHKAEKSLQYIMKAIEDTVDVNDRDVINSPDLSRWSHQGVLLINTAFTTNVGEVGKHYDLWKDFLATLFDYFHWNNPDAIFVMLGKKAQEWDDYIGDHHIKIKASHPASAAYQKQSKWDCNDIFNKINKHLVEQGKTPIRW
jgi:uracil-DNA glycosylase